MPHAWPMPHMDTVTAKLAGKNCFASIDLCQGYWQLPLAKESQECQSFITPDAVYSPTRVLHGQRNATAYCQSTVQHIFTDIKEDTLLWMDDCTFHADTQSGLLDILEVAFGLCSNYGLKLHVKKCKLFLQEVKWCGRIINGSGIKLDPGRLDTLLNMQTPNNGSELQQFLCAANWMRMAIPQYTKNVAVLSDLLECIYSKANKRTKRAVAKVSLKEAGWNKGHDKAFTRVKKALAEAVRLAHPDHSKAFCLFTDASEQHWSGVLTQLSQDSLDLPFNEQAHEPLAFLSGSFTGSSTNWSTAEKEAAAIILSAEKLDYLLSRPQGFHLFTDHSNLVFIFHPEQTDVKMTKNALKKVRRWCMTLSAFQYTIVYIPGDENIWADLLSRWGNPNTVANRSTVQPTENERIARLFKAPYCPKRDDDFVWPSNADIEKAQSKLDSNTISRFSLSKESGIYKNRNGAIFIPTDEIQLQLRICVVGHFGIAGHRGYDITLKNIQKYFFWETMQDDIKMFYDSCLHCGSTSSGRRILGPYGHAMHSDKPNEILHFDFIYMGKIDADRPLEYVLMMKDDASSYAWFHPTESADALSATEGLIKWFCAFGVVKTWISDRVTHFKNKLVEALTHTLHTHYHFTAPNAPQSNGTIERLGRELIRCVRSLLSEFRMKSTEWHKILPVVQSILNHTERDSLGHRAPITVFSGLKADNPLKSLLLPKLPTVKKIDEVKVLRVIEAAKLQQFLDKVHKDVSARKYAKRKAAVMAHNKQTHVLPANFSIGDFVLVANKNHSEGHKMSLKWIGPQ